MSRAPRQRAYCTFCSTTRPLMASGKPERHGPIVARCPGSRYEARPCPSCAGTSNTAECLECDGTGRIVK